MKSFTLTELSRNSGEIVEAAFAGPVALTKHGKSKLIVLPAAQYDALIAKPSSDPRLSRYTHEIDDNEFVLVLDALDARIVEIETQDD
jgi:antitoxin Phd